LRKKKVNEKERQSPWSEETHKVSVKTEQFGQKFYKVRGSDRDYIRGELLNMRFYSVLSLVCLNIKNYKIQKHPKHKHNTSGFSGSRTRSVYLYIRIHMYMYIWYFCLYIYIYIYIPTTTRPLICSLASADQTAYGFDVYISIPTPRGEVGANYSNQVKTTRTPNQQQTQQHNNNHLVALSRC
jgi:hypothetical protein